MYDYKYNYNESNFILHSFRRPAEAQVAKRILVSYFIYIILWQLIAVDQTCCALIV